MARRTTLASLFILLSLAAPAVPARDDPADDPRAISAGFLNHHPDLQYRTYGTEAYGRKDYERAMTLFKRAAYFGDKPSQAMIAEMYARGEGVPPDPALAYAWMDLAAERGYVDFLRLRERYWSRLDEAAQARAIAEGEALYARYGDAAAKPRFATQLRRGSKEGVGGRTGYGGNVKINVPGPSGGETIEGDKFRSASYWDADKYWAMQDRIWRNPGGARVVVGGAEAVRDAPPASRIPPVAPEIDAPPPAAEPPSR